MYVKMCWNTLFLSWKIFFNQLKHCLLKFCRYGPIKPLSEVWEIIYENRESPPLCFHWWLFILTLNTVWQKLKQHCKKCTYWDCATVPLSSSLHSSLFIILNCPLLHSLPLTLFEFLRCVPLWTSSINSYFCCWSFFLKGTRTVGLWRPS